MPDLVARLTDAAAAAIANGRLRLENPTGHVVGDSDGGKRVICHAGHKVTTKRLTVDGAQKQGVLMCWTCQERIQMLPQCEGQTRSGRPCRNAVRVDLGRTQCLVHSEQRQPEEGRP